MQAAMDIQLLHAINVDGTTNVVEAALDQNARALIFTSSRERFSKTGPRGIKQCMQTGNFVG